MTHVIALEDGQSSLGHLSLLHRVTRYRDGYRTQTLRLISGLVTAVHYITYDSHVIYTQRYYLNVHLS